MGTRAQAYALAKVINIPYNASNGYFVIGMDVLDDPSQGLTPSMCNNRIHLLLSLHQDRRKGILLLHMEVHLSHGLMLYRIWILLVVA